jgi:hypothetical protein
VNHRLRKRQQTLRFPGARHALLPGALVNPGAAAFLAQAMALGATPTTGSGTTLIRSVVAFYCLVSLNLPKRPRSGRPQLTSDVVAS